MTQCLDVRRERPVASDRFVLDTNVVLDLTIAGTGADEERRAAYSRFLQTALRVKATLFVPAIVLYELASVIEVVAYVRKFERRHENRDELKRFRADVSARQAVLAELRDVWGQVLSMATVLPSAIDERAVDASLDVMDRSHLDGYVPIVIAAREAGISSIVTHDADFASLDGIIVFSANRRLFA